VAGVQFDPADLDDDSARPLVGRVAELLRAAVKDGRLAPGDDMPPSRRIAAGLGVGLDTVHDAANLLKGEGLLVGGKGRAYRVRVRPPVRLLSGDRYARELEALHQGEMAESAFCTDYGISWEQFTVDAAVSTRAAGAFVANNTGWPAEEMVVRRRLLEYADHAPVQLRTSIVRKALADRVPQLADPGVHPVRGGILAELYDAGVAPETWREWFPVRQPTSSEAQQLDIDPDVWVYQWLRVFTHDGAVVEISETIIPCHALIIHQEGALP
jgi:GntR family transcriptional regulator